MRAGTVVRTSDGREWTVVYHGLDGYGVVERQEVDVDAIMSGHGIIGTAPEGYKWKPTAMLREPYLGCDLECVGSDYEVVEEAK